MKTAAKITSKVLGIIAITLTCPVWLTAAYIKLGLLVYDSIKEGMQLAQNNINTDE
jgi:hypothetical protein